MKKIIIIGGGLSGLITAIRLSNAGFSCILLEKKDYPMHRVCGEYISNETIPFLKANGIFPAEFHPAEIRSLQLTSVSGNAATLPLDLGGFGISRYAFDNLLYGRAKDAGADVRVNTEAEKIHFSNDQFDVVAGGQTLHADLVIGAFGKRSRIDVSLKRNFIQKRSPYLGVKYHIRTEHPADLISLHNFKDGYCGISNIEDGKSNLCYLSHRDNLKRFGSIPEMEKNVLFRNPFLKRIFENSEFLFEKPETINEISFETKGPVEDHMLMTGDAAGMITPLCGNGMAMAIHAASILSSLVISHSRQPHGSRAMLEKEYSAAWKSAFQTRLWTGRQVQRLFGSERASNVAVMLAAHAKPLAGFLMGKTHGQPF